MIFQIFNFISREKNSIRLITIGIKNFLKSSITSLIIFRSLIIYFYILAKYKFSRWMVDLQLHVTKGKELCITRAEEKMEDRPLFDYRQNSIHQFVLKREPCCIIGSYKYTSWKKEKKRNVQLWGRTSGNVIYSQIRKDNRDAFSFHLTRELIMSFTDLSVGSASRHAEPGTEALFPRNPSIPSLKYAITFFRIRKFKGITSRWSKKIHL